MPDILKIKRPSTVTEVKSAQQTYNTAADFDSVSKAASTLFRFVRLLVSASGNSVFVVQINFVKNNRAIRTAKLTPAAMEQAMRGCAAINAHAFSFAVRHTWRKRVCATACSLFHMFFACLCVSQALRLPMRVWRQRPMACWTGGTALLTQCVQRRRSCWSSRRRRRRRSTAAARDRAPTSCFGSTGKTRT